MKILISILIITFFSCKTNTENNGTMPPTDGNFTTGFHKNDTLAMQETARNFLKWYKTNYEKFNGFGLTYQDKQGNFHVSIQNCKEYLTYLQSSGYVSNKYIETWLKYFQDKATYFEKNLITEGPPEGFELDLVLITQEPELVFDDVDNLQFEVFQNEGGKAILLVAAHLGYEFTMSKGNGKWMIDNIGLLNVEIKDEDL